jgi:D-inositol-3-phosphate glycosyltransferase
MRARNPAKLRVAVVEPVGGHGGMDAYDFGLCGGLAGAGVEVTLYTCDETSTSKASAAFSVNLPYRRIYGKGATWLRGLRYVSGSIRALADARLHRARIAHFHFFHVGPLELFNVMMARLLGLKVVITAHDVQSFVENLSVPWMVERAYQAADRVIAQSRVSAAELMAILEGSDNKMDVIPHGNYLHVIRDVPSREEARARVGLPAEGRVLLFFGQIKEVKGLDVLLRAMPRVVRAYPDATLLIAGKEWKDDFGRYERMMEDLGIGGSCVSHIRYIPDTEVPFYYAAADLVVLPYRRIYQSGVLLMAMSYAKATVVSDLAGMTEVVTNGVEGYLFPTGDAKALADKLVNALSDPEEVRLVGQRAHSRAKEHHNWAEIGRATADSYRMTLRACP